MIPHRLTAVLLLSLLGPGPLTAGEAETPAPRAPALLSRVAVVGASVSRGFRHRTSLASVFELAISAPHEKVLSLPTYGVFMDPIRMCDDQVERCIDHEASLVVGIDFLFWYAYGTLRGETELERRSERVTTALKALERLECHVVLGDIPDMRDADPKFLSPNILPTTEVLDALNEQVQAWAKERKNVTLVPIASWVEDLKAGRWKLPPASKDGEATPLPPESVMQGDRLHPNVLGTLVMGDQLMRTLRDRLGAAVSGLGFELHREIERRELEVPKTKSSE